MTPVSCDTSLLSLTQLYHSISSTTPVVFAKQTTRGRPYIQQCTRKASANLLPNARGQNERCLVSYTKRYLLVTCYPIQKYDSVSFSVVWVFLNLLCSKAALLSLAMVCPSVGCFFLLFDAVSLLVLLRSRIYK